MASAEAESNAQRNTSKRTTIHSHLGDRKEKPPWGMGGGGLRVVERNGRVAGVLWCVFHVFHMVGLARPPEREDQDAAGGAKGETGVCSSVCSVPQVLGSSIMFLSRHVICYSLHRCGG